MTRAVDELGLSQVPEVASLPNGEEIIHKLLISGKSIKGNIENDLTDGTVTGTMDGAGTIDMIMDDPTRAILRADWMNKRTRVTLDGRQYVLARISKVGDQITATAETRAVNELRKMKGYKKAYRDAVTRAEFIGGLVSEVKAVRIFYFCPAIHKKQPVEALTQNVASNRKARGRMDARKDPGFSPGARLYVKGAPANKLQVRNMSIVCSILVREKVNHKVAIATIEACIVENEWGTGQGAGSDRISQGILQVIDGQGTVAQRRDIAWSIEGFLNRGYWVHGSAIHIAKTHPSWSPGQVAQWTQGSAYPSRYEERRAEAEHIWTAYNGEPYTGPLSANGQHEEVVIKRYPFERKAGENSWDCIRRLADEVGWYVYMVNTTLIFISGEDLFRSRAVMIVSEDHPAVDTIDFDDDIGQPISEATVYARSNLWEAYPGQVIVVENTGRADGKWLIHDWVRGLYSSAATITLKKPQKDLPEPAPETETRTVSGKLSPGSKLGRTDPQSKGFKTIPPIIAPGANYSYRPPLQPALIEFLSIMGGLLGHAVTVTTGTHHDRLTTSGNVSDHYTGQAADLGIAANGGMHGGDLMAAAALILVGVNPRQAVANAIHGKGTDFTNPHSYNWAGHRVQIGWRTMVGGNHFTHVHIGVA